MPKNIAILGASGYTGVELIRLICGHSDIKIKALAGNSNAGRPLSDIYPHVASLELPDLCKIEDIDWANIDLCFCALPHRTSQAVVRDLPETLRIVDLSADFRLEDPLAYAHWYGHPHQAPELQKEAVYGLTEFYRDDIRKARIVAGTGCNAAAGQFALRPLVEKHVIDLDNIVIDLKAGVSGSGRAMKESLLFAEVSEGYQAYALGGAHRHLGEFDQEFSKAANRSVKVQFAPHLVPANRGILVTCFVKGNARAVHDALADAYANELFLRVLPFGKSPSTRSVRGTNICEIGVVEDRLDDRAVVVAVLDNLTKGSSGQALQNANLMLGFPEHEGLDLRPIFP